MIDYEILKKHKNIALTSSGGADSSIMLFELIQTLEQNNASDINVHIFSLGHAYKDNWNPHVSQGVVRFVINHFKTSLITNHHIYYAPVAERQYFAKSEANMRKNYNVTLQLCATSAAPSTEVLVENIHGKMIDLSNPCPVPTRQEGNYTGHIFEHIVPQNSEYSSFDLYRPYLHTTKDKIADIYKKNNLVDTLFPLTRSCENFADRTNNYTTHCEDCWWCLERKWAFGKV